MQFYKVLVELESMVAEDSGKTSGSPKVDTKPPFQSVKDAVTLFGETALCGDIPAIKKPKHQSTEVCTLFAKLDQKFDSDAEDFISVACQIV